MKVFVIYGKEDICWEDCEVFVFGVGEVWFCVNYVGICGFDLYYYFYGVNGEYMICELFIFGYEFFGVVDFDLFGCLVFGILVIVYFVCYGFEVFGFEDCFYL